MFEAVTAFVSVDALIVSMCVQTSVHMCVCVCVCIFPAALPPGMQHGSSKGDISADRRASFPSPLPSGVALNIKLFNLIQFLTTNTADWIQMPATSWPTPGPVCAQGLDTLELELRSGLRLEKGVEMGMELQFELGDGSGTFGVRGEELKLPLGTGDGN